MANLSELTIDERFALLLPMIGFRVSSPLIEICVSMDDIGCKPVPADTQNWSAFYDAIRAAEQDGYIKSEWAGDSFSSAQLTEAGRVFVKGLKRARR